MTFRNVLLAIFFIFQELYCDDLPEITCPTKEDFEFFDMDGDGILTWSEWKSVHASNHPDDNTL